MGLFDKPAAQAAQAQAATQPVPVDEPATAPGLPPSLLSGEAMHELMARAPDLWTQRDLENLILTFRAARANFSQAKAIEQAGGKKVVTRKSKSSSVDPALLDQMSGLVDLSL